LFSTDSLSFSEQLKPTYQRWLGLNKCSKWAGSKTPFAARLQEFTLKHEFRAVFTAEEACRELNIDLAKSEAVGNNLLYSPTSKEFAALLEVAEDDDDFCGEMMVYVAKHAHVDILKMFLVHTMSAPDDAKCSDLHGTIILHFLMKCRTIIRCDTIIRCESSRFHFLTSFYLLYSLPHRHNAVDGRM
jgi:hypothetical protein